jgi:hypothetical protein
MFDPTQDIKKKSIILKVENVHYTILRQRLSSTVELSRLCSTENVNRPPFLHIECPTLQMPDIEKYQVFSSSNAYLGGALPGPIPGLEDRIRIWNAVKHLIPDDFRTKENSGSSVDMHCHDVQLFLTFMMLQSCLCRKSDSVSTKQWTLNNYILFTSQNLV